ncbi:hypothetical protein AC1031_000386 [Aphanomyces cochlioides]|nr:hypothetical protein AC1031_000386 [Aphanomyces cochlioides]
MGNRFFRLPTANTWPVERCTNSIFLPKRTSMPFELSVDIDKSFSLLPFSKHNITDPWKWASSLDIPAVLTTSVDGVGQDVWVLRQVICFSRVFLLCEVCVDIRGEELLQRPLQGR